MCPGTFTLSHTGSGAVFVTGWKQQMLLDDDSGEEDKVPAKTERKVNAAVHFDDETSEETDDSGSESASEDSYSEYEYESEASDEDE